MHSTDAPRLAWIDATAGVAGDMLLGALLDTGADLDQVQSVLDALIPGSVRLGARRVDRCGQSALKLDVEVLVEDPPHRTWASIRELLTTAREDGRVPARTCDLALAAFERLARAEGATHGMDPEQVHFHEVGALDSIADVVGACEAWRQLGITEALGSVIAVGSGRIRAAHGDIPVPVPAVARLAMGWPTVAGDLLPARGHSHGNDHQHDHTHDVAPDAEEQLPEHAVGGPHSAPRRPLPAGVAPGIGELATPTGVALIRALCRASGPQPTMETLALGVGAGTKDTPGRPNVVRVLIGTRPVAPADTTAAPADASAVSVGADPAAGTAFTHDTADAHRPSNAHGPLDAHDTPTRAAQLEANVDDLDPRLWPGVVDSLLAEGALDAWLTPIIMKGGRPAVTVHTLVRSEAAETISARIMALTGSLGVRRHLVERMIRIRSFEEIELDGQRIRVKVARDAAGDVQRREPEFRDVAAAARALGITEREALDRARALAAALS